MNDLGHANRRLNNSEFWGGAIGFALGIFVIFSGYKLDIGSISDPGSGFVLFYLGIVMCIFASTIMVSALSEGGATFGSLWAGTLWMRPILVIISLVVFSVALEPLGFLLSTIPLLFLLLRIIDPVRWTLAVPLAVLAPLGVWWLLKHGLLIQLPSGIFEIG